VRVCIAYYVLPMSEERLATGIEGLDKIFNPKRIAVIGASNKEGSVGFRLLNNLIGVGFRGFVYPVNPFSPSVQGITAYPSVRKIPWQIDLAAIATPAHIVAQIVEECGESGITGIIIISSGFSETGLKGKALEEEILRLKNTYNMRIVGPNCLGVMRPSVRLNATFANKMAKPGKIALVSQSGALCASVLDWAAQANVGFSNFVSVGSMIDVDFADLIDYFGVDPETRCIVLFVEAIKDARRFMSAARRFAGTKPIIVIKAGKSPEGMKAASCHTGAFTGEDAIYDAAFRRVGIIRVEEIADLFCCSEILAMQPRPKGPNLAIITNAGGPGVMATDFLISRRGKLASLSDMTIRALDEVLPSYWSRSNPIDICDNATVERFRKVLGICFKDPNVDGFLIIYTPIGAADPAETAKTLLKIAENIDKPVLTSWLGEEDVREARDILRRNGIPTYPTPEQAITTFMYIYQYSRNLELLYETPEELPISPSVDKHHLNSILDRASEEGREILSEPESKEFLEAYDIPTMKTYIAETADKAVQIASKVGYPVVIKVLSPQMIRETDLGRVALKATSESQVKRCFEDLIDRVKGRDPAIKIEGITVQPMMKERGYELLVRSKKDPLFGSVIIFGSGGMGAELFNDISVGFPPLNQTLARRMIEQTKAYKLLSGWGNRRPANIRLLEEILVKFSQLIIDFPQIKEVEMSPLLIDESDATALDAKIVIDRNHVSAKTQPREHLVIKPYPTKYITESAIRDGKKVSLRPIRPEDEPLIVDLFRTFSEQTMRLGFFRAIKEIFHETLARYCNIDYDREMTIVAERREEGSRKIIGMVRLIIQPSGERGEVAVVVGDPWQNLGLGSKMLDYIVGISKDIGLKAVFGEVLAENTKMIHLFSKRGFEIKHLDEENCLATLDMAKGGPTRGDRNAN